MTPREKRKHSRRQRLITLLRGVADGGWQDCDGRNISPADARDAIRILEREWGLGRKAKA